jgi:hypothetical protein
MQLIGMISIMAALVLVARRMIDDPAADWAVLGMIGAVRARHWQAACKPWTELP